MSLILVPDPRAIRFIRDLFKILGASNSIDCELKVDCE